MGLVLTRLAGDPTKRALARITLGGLLIPLGILGEVVLGTSPVFVLPGRAMMFVAVTCAGVTAAEVGRPSPRLARKSRPC